MPSTKDSPLSSTERAELITKAEQAADEVLKSRIYIYEIEEQLKATDATLHDAEKVNLLSKDEIIKLQAERKELTEAIEYWKKAETERMKEMVKLTAKVNRLEGEVRFWRKVALVTGAILAVGAAAVVMRK